MKSRINSLTGMRFIMIMTIVISHLEFLSGGDSKNAYDLYFHNAFIALDFFFILSGFGLTYGQSLKGFLPMNLSLVQSVKWSYRKMKKIYWLYIITITFGLLIAILYPSVKPLTSGYLIECILNYLLCIPMLQSITGQLYYSHLFNGVCWFVSSLLFLYILYPFLYNFTRKIAKNIGSCVVCILLTVIIYVILYHFLYVEFKDTAYQDLYYGHPIIRIFPFLLGILLCRLFSFSYSSVRERDTTIAEAVIVLTAIVYFFLRNASVMIEEIKILLDILVAASLVYILAFEKGKISLSISNSKWFVRLGEAAMYIYLLHYPIRMHIPYRIHGKVDYQYENLLIVFLILVLTAFASYICVYISGKQNHRKQRLTK